MGAQGVVSLTSGGATVVKAVCGCGGMNAAKLACRIRREHLVSVQDIYEAARVVGFGCRDCLMVMDKNSLVYQEEEGTGPDRSDRYVSTFSDPKFNPRRESGGADYVEVVDQEGFCPWLREPEQVEVLEAFPGVITGDVEDTLYPIRVGNKRGKEVEGHVGQENLRAFPYPISLGVPFVWVRYRTRGGVQISHTLGEAWPTEEHWNPELKEVWHGKG